MKVKAVGQFVYRENNLKVLVLLQIHTFITITRLTNKLLVDLAVTFASTLFEACQCFPTKIFHVYKPAQHDRLVTRSNINRQNQAVENTSRRMYGVAVDRLDDNWGLQN